MSETVILTHILECGGCWKSSSEFGLDMQGNEVDISGIIIGVVVMCIKLCHAMK